MEVKKYDKIVLDSTRSIDDIAAGIKAELSKQESQNAGESYICYVSHAYSSGDNAGVNYIVVSDEFKNLNGLSSNVIKASAYTKDEINELIARVDAKIPVDEAKLAKQNELKRVEADILGKEQSIPAKRQELLTLNEQKRTLEANLATITELINEKEQAGENTEILQAQKRQYESDIATKSSQITNLEREINQLNSDIEVLNQTKERLKREEALIQSPELATKEYVDELKANLDSKSSELNSRIDSVNSDLTNIIDTKANADAVVNLTDDQTIEGVKTFSAVPIVATQPTDDNEIANKAYVDGVGNAKVALTKYSSEVLIPLTADLVWSVGTTQKSGASKHFSDISSAINEALKYRQTSNKCIDLYLTSDITVPNQLYYYGVDLNYLRIQGGRSDSNAGFKIIAGANLNANKSNRYIFHFDKCSAPLFIGVTFKGNWVPNTTPRPTGMKAGAKADNGLIVTNGAFLQTHDCRFENFNNAILVRYNCKACFYGSITAIENCNVGVFTHENSDVIFHNTTILNTNIAVISHTLARVFLYRGNISKSSLGLEVMYGGQITISGITLALQTDETNKNSRDANVAYSAVTNHGIIFKN